MAHRVDDLLLPLVKGVGSERAYELLTESLQLFGGSGFLQDYPIEQYIRDAKIDSLYEGTTAIQSLDLFFRKIVRDRGEALAHIADQITHTIDTCDPVLKTQADQLRTALDHVQAITARMTSYLMAAAEQPTEINKVGLASVRYLLALGDLLIGWRLLVQATVADAALTHSTADDAFYRGKIATATFFAANVLPHLAVLRSIVDDLGDDIMSLPEAAF
jgi:Acetyl-CoA dehydrogenase C-terminal like/Acyl-CoA dehydrogenase, C-terminal domain